MFSGSEAAISIMKYCKIATMQPLCNPCYRQTSTKWKYWCHTCLWRLRETYTAWGISSSFWAFSGIGHETGSGFGLLFFFNSSFSPLERKRKSARYIFWDSLNILELWSWIKTVRIDYEIHNAVITNPPMIWHLTASQ